jgi:hypothetical protein
MAESTVKISTTQKWAERLRGRSRMAVATIGAIFAAGFFFASRPLGERIDHATDRLAKAEARMELAGNVGDLRRQAALFTKRLPQSIDLNDWTNYLLNGIRAQRVRLSRMDPKETLTLGPCKVLSWQIELEGDFESLSRVVEWLESGPRLVRIDRLIMQSGHGTVSMSIIVKGLVLDTPAAPAGKKTDKEQPATPVMKTAS